jgi:hypothetical protein
MGPKYPAIGQSWRRAWPEVVPFYAFHPDVRRLVYTTNAIEALNSKLRRAVRARGHFPTDEAATKLLFLILNRSEKEWTTPRRSNEGTSRIFGGPSLFGGTQYDLTKPQEVKLVASHAASLHVAVIDGPYDADVLSGIADAPISLGFVGRCLGLNNGCDHGTFIMGLLGARQDALIPGLCPDCRLLHVPLFINENSPSASIGELANAIRAAVGAGARLINLSLAILGDDSQYHPELAAALDYAEANGAVLVAAAGNQGRLTTGQLISHPVTIPVVAVDAAQRVLPECNFGPVISRRGVAALGQLLGYAPRGGTAVMSGTSVATAVVTGTLAQVWSACPFADGAEIRAAVASLASRHGAMPPMLDRDTLFKALGQTNATMFAGASVTRSGMANYASLQGGSIMISANGQPMPLIRGADSEARRATTVIPAHGSGGCACGSQGETCTCENGGSSRSRFIYVLGTVDIRFPDQSISEELETVARTSGIPAQSPNESLRHYYHRVLSLKTADGRLMARRGICAA